MDDAPNTGSMDMSSGSVERLLAQNRALAGGGRRWLVLGGVVGLVAIIGVIAVVVVEFVIPALATKPKGSTSTTLVTTTATTTLAITTPQPPAGPCKDVPNCKTCRDGKSCTECNEGFQKMGHPTQCMYACTTSVTFPIVQADKKGLGLDDTTLRYCPDKAHSQWPNTKQTVATVRTTKFWEVDWDQSQKEKHWDSIALYLHTTGAKALIGTSITCDETLDDADWKDVLKLLKKVGPKFVMGVGVGNELDLVHTLSPKVKGTFPNIEACAINMWKDGGYLQRKFISRVEDLDALGSGWTNVKVMTILGGSILGGNPFANRPDVRVNSWFKYILKKYKTRYVFTLNIYSYFDPHNPFDPGARTCKRAIAASTCFDKSSCNIPSQIAAARRKMITFDKENHGLGMKDLEFWLTETGWSSPTANTLYGANGNMASCKEFSSLASLSAFYKNFLKWDMTIPGAKAVDQVFYFTMRDAENFNHLEHFGLGGTDPKGLHLCTNTTCKI